MTKTVGLKRTSDICMSPGGSLAISLLHKVWPQSWNPGSCIVRTAWLAALKLIGAIRDNDFPVHTLSEQLLFKYFPYSSFTGKQYLIETS
jgi:hypothetical protein